MCGAIQLQFKAGWHPVAISNDRTLVVSGSVDAMIKLWNIKTERDPVALDTHAERVWPCDPLPDGHRPVVSETISAALWDCKTSHPVLRLEKHTACVTGLAVSPDARRAATCSEDRSFKIWNLSEALP